MELWPRFIVPRWRLRLDQRGSRISQTPAPRSRAPKPSRGRIGRGHRRDGHSRGGGRRGTCRRVPGSRRTAGRAARKAPMRARRRGRRAIRLSGRRAKEPFWRESSKMYQALVGMTTSGSFRSVWLPSKLRKRMTGTLPAFSQTTRPSRMAGLTARGRCGAEYGAGARHGESPRYRM